MLSGSSFLTAALCTIRQMMSFRWETGSKVGQEVSPNDTAILFLGMYSKKFKAGTQIDSAQLCLSPHYYGSQSVEAPQMPVDR